MWTNSAIRRAAGAAAPAGEKDARASAQDVVQRPPQDGEADRLLDEFGDVVRRALIADGPLLGVAAHHHDRDVPATDLPHLPRRFQSVHFRHGVIQQDGHQLGLMPPVLRHPFAAVAGDEDPETEVLQQGGFSRVRRAAETPTNIVLEARH